MIFNKHVHCADYLAYWIAKVKSPTVNRPSQSSVADASGAHLRFQWPQASGVPQTPRLPYGITHLIQENPSLPYIWKTMIIFTVSMHDPYAVTKCYVPCADHTGVATVCKQRELAWVLVCSRCCY